MRVVNQPYPAMTNDFYTVGLLTAEFRNRLQVIVKRDGSRHMMDAHIDMHTMAAIEDELLPALDAVIACIEWEPSDADLCPGEPPMTADEMHSIAHAQHITLHS